MEEKIIDGGFGNSVSWFKKKPSSRDVVEALFSRIVKVSTDKDTGEPDGKWPPSMKVKVPRRDGIWETKVSDKSGKVYDINNSDSGDNLEELLVKNTKMRAIIQCVGLWVASGSYMCQWKLTKAEIEVPESSGQHEFLADSDDEDGEEAPDNFIEDSNDEDGDGDAGDGDGDGDDAEEEPAKSPTPESEPAPAPKKKVVRRKVTKKAA